jgi:hypothetical protein
MRLALRLLAILAIPVALFGTLIVAKSGIFLYMLSFGGVAPGEPMSVDELAPTVADASAWLIVGVLLVAASLLLRAVVRRRLQITGTSK